MSVKTLITKFKYKLFPFLELKDKNISRKKKARIWIDTIVNFFLYIYIFLYFFSYLFYAYKIENKHMNIYSNNNISIDKKFKNTIVNSMKRLSKLDIFFQNYQVKIYLIDNQFLYHVQTFFQNKIAGNLFDTIFIDNQYLASEDYYESLYTEIVHEIIHTFQAHKYGGWIKTKLVIPYWVSEGYAVYMSRKDLAKNDKKFIASCSKKNFKNLTISNIYILNGLMVKHAIEKMHKSVDDLHLGKVEYDEVLDSLLREYNITKE